MLCKNFIFFYTHSGVPLGMSLSSATFTLLLMLTLLPIRTRLPTCASARTIIRILLDFI